MTDTHAHYDDERLCADEFIDSVFDNGVDRIVSCATDFDSAKRVLDICEKHEGMYAAVGVFPEDTAKYEWDEQRLEALAAHKKVVAIGEIGLEYHYDDVPRDRQIFWVKKQIELANKLKLPISFHDREAHGDTMDILRELRPRGVVHCFSGSVEMSRETVKLGMYIGVGGVVTFKNARVLPDVVKDVPTERILLETDAPYLAPVPMRGKTNRSDYLIYVAEKIGELKGISTEEVIKITDKNAAELFGF